MCGSKSRDIAYGVTLQRHCSLRCRVREKAPAADANGCWNFAGPIRDDGYGVLTVGDNKQKNVKYILAHRASYEAFVGSIPEGAFVLHSCDNRACVNPAHLRAGDQFDNMNDAIVRGRFAEGENSPHAKLTASDVLSIRRSSEGPTELARQFGVSAPTICDVKARRTWKRVA